jgi:quinol-cytochrome oxidoreductase complex cytochrome b subunit
MPLTDRILALIAALQSIVVAIVGPLLDFVDARQVVRRVFVLVVLWQLVDCYVWAKAFAYREGMTGLELGAVIAAVLAPVSALAPFLFRMYDSSRREGGA